VKGCQHIILYSKFDTGLLLLISAAGWYIEDGIYADFNTEVLMGQQGRPSIMLVEDNEMIRELITELLSSEYEQETYSDAETALARARERGFDLVLLDVSLPNMSGMEAIKVLRGLPAYSGVPIVAMTGHTSPEQHAKYLEMGFTEHLGKPFMPDELIELVENLLSPAGDA
jgi:two-component system, sensor histidine kinase